jgi:hypothetical protein
MGTISISLPIKVNGTFRVRDRKVAQRLVDELEQIGERITPIDELFGIWSDDPERVKEVSELRKRSRHRNG